MITKQPNICSNNCEFAKKAILLSKAGTAEIWLYLCMKIDRHITSDSVIFEVGCATYNVIPEKTPPESKEAQKVAELLKEVDQELTKIEKELDGLQKPEEHAPVLVRDKSPEDIPIQRQTVFETTKPEKPATIPVPAAIPPPPHGALPVGIPPVTQQEPKKKRGRKPKQVVPEPAPAIVQQPVKPEQTGVIEKHD
jgi:hypothetical protein